jgi:hypothetical protein
MSRTKKPKPRDFVGRLVRLMREHTTRGGALHPAGTIYRCTGGSQKGGTLDLSLPKRRPDIDGMYLRRVSVADVELVTGRHCKVCGCTEADCRGCVERTGEPCTWVGPNLCSACVEE